MQCHFIFIIFYRRIVPEFVLPVTLLILLQNIIGLPPRTLPVGLVTNMENVTTTVQLDEFCNNFNSSGSECLENVGICSFIDTFENREFDWVRKNRTDKHVLQIFETTQFSEGGKFV